MIVDPDVCRIVGEDFISPCEAVGEALDANYGAARKAFFVTTSAANASEVRETFKSEAVEIIDYSTTRETQSYRYRAELEGDVVSRKARRALE